MRVSTESAGVLAVDGVACTHNLLLHFKRHMYILRDTSRLFLLRKLLILQVKSLAPCSRFLVVAFDLAHVVTCYFVDAPAGLHHFFSASFLSSY